MATEYAKDLVSSSGIADVVGDSQTVKSDKLTIHDIYSSVRDLKFNELLLSDPDFQASTQRGAVKLGRMTADQAVKEQRIVPGSPEYTNTIASEAKRVYQEALDRAQGKVAAGRISVRKMVNEGALDAFLPDDDIKATQDAVAKRQLVNRSYEKSFIDFAKEVPDDRLSDVLLKGYTTSKKLSQGRPPQLEDKYTHLKPEEAQRLGQMQTEPWLPDVAQEQGLVGAGTRLLTPDMRALDATLVRGKQNLVAAPAPESSFLQRAAGTAATALISPIAAAGEMAAEAGAAAGKYAPGAVEAAKSGLRAIGDPLERADVMLRSSKLMPKGKLGQMADAALDYGPLRWPQQAEAALNIIAPTKPEQTTFGAPARDIVEKLRDPGTVADVASGIPSYIYEGITGPSNQFSLEREVQTAQKQRQLAAVKKAREDNLGAPPEILAAAAKKNYADMRESESMSFAENSPAALQSAIEMASPAPIVSGVLHGAGAATRAGLKALRNTEKGAEMLNALGRGRWMNEMNILDAEAAAKAPTPEVAQGLHSFTDQTRLSADRGTTAATNVVSELSPEIATQEALLKTDAQKQLVWDVVHGKAPIESIPDELRPAVEAQYNFNNKMYALGASPEHQVLARKGEGDLLELAPQRPDYGAPHLIAKDPNAVVESSLIHFKEGPQAGMAKSRTAPMEMFLADPVAQNRAALREMQSKVAKAATASEMQRLLGGTAKSEEALAQESKALYGTPPEQPMSIPRGVVTHRTEGPPIAAPASQIAKDPAAFVHQGGYLINIPRATTPEEVAAVEKMRQEMERTTGTKWATLNGKDAENANLWELATGAPGVTKVGTTDLLAPAEAIQTIRDLFPRVGIDKRSGGQIVGDYMNKYLGPVNRMLRGMATTIGSGMQFVGLNGATALTIPMEAHGLKALDPNLLGTSMHGALELAARGEPSARAAQVVLGGGKQVALGELLDTLTHYGYVNQFDASLAGGMKQQGLLRGAAGAVGKWSSATLPLPGVLGAIPFGMLPGKAGEVARLLSTRTLAQGLDNMQRLTTIIPFLKDLSPASVAEAVSKAGKYVGNYNRLSPLERDIMQNLTFFYGWSKIVLGGFAESVKKNPEVMVNFAKGRLIAEREAHTYAPPTSIPSWGIGTMYPTGKTPDGQLVFGKPQTPDVLALEYAKMAEPIVRALMPGLIGGPSGDSSLADMAPPPVKVLLMAIMNAPGRSSTVVPTLDPRAYASPGQFYRAMKGSAIGGAMLGPTGKSVDNTMAMIDFLLGERQYTAAMGVALAYKASRIMGLSNPFMPEYTADAQKNMARQQRSAVVGGQNLERGTAK